MSVFPELRDLAASEEWQAREVAATAMVELSKRDPDSVAKEAARWARDRDPNVRRAASEGLRNLVQREPEKVLPVLHALRADPNRYVQKSVANVLRNATRKQLPFVLRLCSEWAESRDANTHWIIRDGLRKAAAAAPQETARILKSIAP
ncbi:hypothetical protein BH23GEM1_BH23GEM1_06550 [soil metagenome]